MTSSVSALPWRRLYFIWDLPSARGIRPNDLISFAILRNDVVPRTPSLHLQKGKKGAKTERKAGGSCHRAALHSSPSSIPGHTARTPPARPCCPAPSRPAKDLARPNARKIPSICPGHEGRGKYVIFSWARCLP